MNLSHSAFLKAIVALSLTGILALPGEGGESAVFLRPPGFRLVEDPSIVIPTVHQYLNQNLELPNYRDSAGKPEKGWTVEVIGTRRFSSSQSARLYFRMADLVRSTVFEKRDVPWDMRIWPSGTILILEAYDGDGSVVPTAKPVEIVAMSKMGTTEAGSSSVFYPVDWSYARFTPQGEPSLLPDDVQECHRCHSIAFHLTGDLIFTQFAPEEPCAACLPPETDSPMEE